MNEQRLRERLVELRPPSPEEHRVSAARYLAEERSLPAWCAEPLVAALDDDASREEVWTDWDGTIVGGATHHAREYARAALLRLGAPAIEPLTRRAGDRTLLAEIVGQASPDALSALPSEVLAALPTLVEGTPSRDDALRALAWRDSGATEPERLIARLRHHASSVVADASVALAAMPASQAIADAIFGAVARGAAKGPDAERAVKGLEALAPHASDAAMNAFLAARLGPKSTPSFAELRAVLAWGPRAKAAAGALLALFQSRLFSANVVMEATLPAMVVAAVLGPPSTADDVRVVQFRLLKEQRGSLSVVSAARLDVLVKACGGASRLSPFVLDELTRKLIDGPHEARADAVPRLFALREAAEPAGEAMLVALDAFIAAKKPVEVSATCWALAHAGAARQRALPRFIAMLETDSASAALHGLHGMADEALSALPAIDAFLSKNPKNPERTAAVRLIETIRHQVKKR